MYRDSIGKAHREIHARTVAFFVYKLPGDGEDGNVVGAGELGSIIIIDFCLSAAGSISSKEGVRSSRVVALAALGSFHSYCTTELRGDFCSSHRSNPHNNLPAGKV